MAGRLAQRRPGLVGSVFPGQAPHASALRVDATLSHRANGSYTKLMRDDLDRAIHAFLSGSPFAVAGASRSRSKYGNMVLRCYWRHGRVAYPVNPHHTELEGAPCFPSLSALPERPHGVSLITQPEISESIVEEALQLGIRHFWFQPGAEHPDAIERARDAGSVVIAGGPCLLVVLPRM